MSWLWGLRLWVWGMAKVGGDIQERQRQGGLGLRPWCRTTTATAITASTDAGTVRLHPQPLTARQTSGTHQAQCVS